MQVAEMSSLHRWLGAPEGHVEELGQPEGAWSTAAAPQNQVGKS